MQPGDLDWTVVQHLERRELGALLELALGDPMPYLRAAGDGVGSDAYPAVARRARDVLPLLADPAPSARGGAAYLLAFLVDIADESLAAVRARRAREADPAVRASLILAEGYLAAVAEGERHEEPPALGGSAVEDFAAVVAHAVRGSPLFGVEVSGELFAAFEQALGWGPIDGLAWPAARVAEANRWRVRPRWDPSGAGEGALVFDHRPEVAAAPDEPGDGEADVAGGEASTDPYSYERPAAMEAGSVPVDLAGLDEVPWPSLENAYGPADNVPEQIRALASLDAAQRRWGVEALFAGINHQGSIYSASGPAAPFLVTLATDARVADRDRILRLLLGLAMNDPVWRVVDGARGDRSSCYEAVLAGADGVLPLVADPDVLVRTEAAFLIAFLDPGRDPRPAVRAALDGERDPRARASHMLCLGMQGRYRGDRQDEARLASLLGDENRLVRAAAALALVSALGAAAPPRALAMLDELQRRRFRVAGPFGWHDGNIAEYAGVLLRAHRTAGQILDSLVELAPGVAHQTALGVLARLFPRRHATWTLDQLDADQRRILHHFAAGADGVPADSTAGLPQTARALRRFLGVDPPGPLDAELDVAGRRWPIWRAVEAVLTDELDEAELVRAVADRDAIALTDDLLSRTYMVLFPRHRDWRDLDADLAYQSRGLLLTATICAAAGERGVAWARAAAAAQLGAERADAMICAVAGVVLARAGALDGQPDQLIRLDDPPGSTYPGPLREMLAAVPLARRGALLDRIALHSITKQVDPRGGTYHWRRGLGWHLIDLLPTAAGAERVLASLRAFERLHVAPHTPPGERPSGLVRAPYPLPRPEEPFPRDRALAVLAAHGRAALPVLEAALATGDIIDRAFLDEALARCSAS